MSKPYVGKMVAVYPRVQDCLNCEDYEYLAGIICKLETLSSGVTRPPAVTIHLLATSGQAVSYSDLPYYEELPPHERNVHTRTNFCVGPIPYE